MLCPHFSVSSPTFIFTASEVTSPNPTPEHDYVAAHRPFGVQTALFVADDPGVFGIPNTRRASRRFRCLKLGMIVVPTTFS
jgi:hypothetical protein